LQGPAIIKIKKKKKILILARDIQKIL